MVQELIKWVLEKQTDLNGPGKKEKANPWAVYSKARMSHSRPKVI